MPSSTPRRLIDLIRLLHGDLSSVNAATIRDYMAGNPSAALLFVQLQKCQDQPFSADERLHHTKHYTAERIGKFVDGYMSDSDAKAFEDECSEDLPLLREVVIAWQACQQWNTPMPSDVERFMSGGVVDASDSVAATMGIVSERRLLKMAAEAYRVADLSAGAAAASDDRNEPSAEQTVGVVGLGDGATIASAMPDQQCRYTSSSYSARQKQRSSVAVIATVASLVLLLTVVFWNRHALFDQSDELTNSDESRKDPHGTLFLSPKNNVNTPEKAMPRVPSVVVDNEKDVQSPKNVLKDPSDNEAVVQTPPDEKMDLQLKSPDSAVNEESLVNHRASSAVKALIDSDGVVAVRIRNAGWSGIYSPLASKLLLDAPTAEIMTANGSLLSAELKNGSQLLLDGNTRMSLGNADSELSSTSDATSEKKPLVAEIEILYGKVAVLAMPAGTSLNVVTDDLHWHVTATEDNTSITVYRVQPELMLGLSRGAATLNERPLKRRSWMQSDRSGEVIVVEAPPDSDQWIRNRKSKNLLPKTLVVAANAANDISLIAPNSMNSQVSTVTFHGTQVLLQFADRKNKTHFTKTVRQFAMSTSEAHRNALVDWLLTEMLRNPTNAGTLCRTVLLNGGVAAAETDRISSWYFAALRKQQPTIRQTQEVVVAIQNGRTLLERQSAKYFLRAIFDDPLNDYDVTRPNNTRAIRSLNMKFQNWRRLNAP